MTKNANKKTDVGYSYFSRVLNKPFDTIEELKEAEQTYYDKLKAKEDAANQKKLDAQKVEEALKALNAARKTYKEELTQLTTEYSEELINLKKAYDLGKADIRSNLATAEDAYETALKNFTTKYPEGYHQTIKDGDFETTISAKSSGTKDAKSSKDFPELAEIFNLIFGI